MCVYHSGTLVSTMPENKPGGAGHLRAPRTGPFNKMND